MINQDAKLSDGNYLSTCGISVITAKIVPGGLKTISCNEAFTTLSGHSAEAIIGNPPAHLCRADDSDIDAMARAIECAKKGEAGIFASRFIHKDGNVFAARCMVTAQFDNAGAPTHIVFVCTPISADDPNLRWFGKNGLLFHTEKIGRTGAFRYRYTTQTFLFSDNYYALHGLESKHDSPAQILELATNSDKNKLINAISECRQSGEGFEMAFSFRRKDGAQRYAVINAEPETNSVGEVVGVLGTLRDETKIKHLQQRQELFLRAAKIGFIEVNLQTEKMKYSSDVSRIMGAASERGEISIADWRARIHPEDLDKALANFTACVANMSTHTQRYRFLTEDAVYRWIEVRAAAHHSADSSHTIVLGTVADIDDQIRDEQELNAIRSRLDFAVDSAELGLWSWDVRANAKKAMSWSPKMRDILGLDETTQPTWDVLETLIHPIERAAATDVILSAAETEANGGFRMEHRFIRPDGTVIWVENRGLAQYDDKGRIKTIAGALQDITERKDNEAELIESQKRFHDVAAITGECIFECDIGGRLIYVSSAVRQIYGYEPEELIGTMPFSITQEIGDDPKAWIKKVHKDRGWDNVEREIERKDGSKGWVTINGRAVLDAVGEIAGFRGAVTDTTEQHHSIEKLVKSERRTSDVVRIAGGCIFDLDLKGNVIYVSKNAREVFGVTAAELIGKPTYILAPELEPSHNEWLRAIRNSDGGLESDFKITPLDGQPDRWLRTTCRVLTNDSGDVIGFRGIGFDVTVRKQADLEIIKAKKAAEAAAEERARFLATMSHEIRTPLNAVIGMTDVLLDMPQDKDQRELTASANTAGKHLLELVNDILDFSKLDAKKLVVENIPFDLQDEIKTVHNMLAVSANEKGLPIKLDFDNSCRGEFLGDPARIRQILVNLMGNAIKFTAKGQVTIRVEKTGETKTEETKNGQNKSQCMRFSVIDTGTGINPEVLPSLFQDFAQADSSITRTYGGTGLGLAICKRLAEVMGGKIGADSVTGEGSTFWFEIPLSPCKASQKRKTKAKTERQSKLAKQHKLRVLVAEDNQANQLLIKTILKRVKHDYVIVENGELAVKAALVQPFDIILMDVQMPKMDGISATRHLREAGCQTPIIALTAHVLADEEEQFRAAGMDAWISKPFDARNLVAAMHHWAQKRPQPQALANKPQALANKRA